MTAPAASTAATLTVAEAAELLGRHRTRIYALVRSGDLVAVSGTDGGDEHTLLLDRSSVERWAVAGGSRGGPLTSRNAWAIIGLASGDQALADHCLGLLERREEHSRVRARLAADGLLGLAPRLRRRASLSVVHLPPSLFVELERDASLVRTGISSAVAYGWDECSQTGQPWALDAYLRPEALQVLVDEVAAADTASQADAVPVLLRTVDGPWPFPSHCQLVPQPLAALDLLDYPEPDARRVGREVLHSLGMATPTVVARRSARGRVLTSPRVGNLLAVAAARAPRQRVTSDPGADTPAAAAQIVGVLWANDKQGATVNELRGAIGLTRERLEAAYTYLLEHPPLGLAIERHGEELRLTSAAEVAPAIERHRESPRPVALSDAALLVLTIVAYRQPVSRAGIETVRGTSSESALATLLQRQLIAVDQHRLFVTTTAFLEYLGLRDLADLPPLPSVLEDESADPTFVVSAGWTP